MESAGLDTKLKSHMDKTNDFINRTDISLDSKIVPSTSCAPYDMQRSWLGIRGKWAGPDTDMAWPACPSN